MEHSSMMYYSSSITILCVTLYVILLRNPALLKIGSFRPIFLRDVTLWKHFSVKSHQQLVKSVWCIALNNFG